MATKKTTVKKTSLKITDKVSKSTVKKTVPKNSGVEEAVYYEESFYRLDEFKSKKKYSGSIKKIPEKFDGAEIIKVEKSQYISTKEALVIADALAIHLWDENISLAGIEESQLNKLILQTILSSKGFEILQKDLNTILEKKQKCFKISK